MPAINHEIMAFRLTGDRLVDCVIQELIGLRGTQRAAKIGGVILTKAHVESAGASYAHPIARFTEIVCERRNET